eukprot:403337360
MIPLFQEFHGDYENMINLQENFNEAVFQFGQEVKSQDHDSKQISKKQPTMLQLYSTPIQLNFQETYQSYNKNSYQNQRFLQGPFGVCDGPPAFRTLSGVSFESNALTIRIYTTVMKPMEPTCSFNMRIINATASPEVEFSTSYYTKTTTDFLGYFIFDIHLPNSVSYIGNLRAEVYSQSNTGWYFTNPSSTTIIITETISTQAVTNIQISDQKICSDIDVTATFYMGFTLFKSDGFEESPLSYDLSILDESTNTLVPTSNILVNLAQKRLELSYNFGNSWWKKLNFLRLIVDGQISKQFQLKIEQFCQITATSYVTVYRFINDTNVKLENELKYCEQLADQNVCSANSIIVAQDGQANKTYFLYESNIAMNMLGNLTFTDVDQDFITVSFYLSNCPTPVRKLKIINLNCKTSSTITVTDKTTSFQVNNTAKLEMESSYQFSMPTKACFDKPNDRFSLIYEKDGITIAKPSFVGFDNGWGTITINVPLAVSSIGVYKFNLTYSNFSPTLIFNYQVTIWNQVVTQIVLYEEITTFSVGYNHVCSLCTLYSLTYRSQTNFIPSQFYTFDLVNKMITFNYDSSQSIYSGTVLKFDMKYMGAIIEIFDLTIINCCSYLQKTAQSSFTYYLAIDSKPTINLVKTQLTDATKTDCDLSEYYVKQGSTETAIDVNLVGTTYDLSQTLSYPAVDQEIQQVQFSTDTCTSTPYSSITLKTIDCTKHITFIHPVYNQSYLIGGPGFSTALSDLQDIDIPECIGEISWTYSKDGISSNIMSGSLSYLSASQILRLEGSSDKSFSGFYQIKLFTNQLLPTQGYNTLNYVLYNSVYLEVAVNDHYQNFTYINYHQCSDCVPKPLIYELKDNNGLTIDPTNSTIYLDAANDLIVYFNKSNTVITDNELLFKRYFQDSVVETYQLRYYYCCRYLDDQAQLYYYYYIGFDKPNITYPMYEINPNYPDYQNFCEPASLFVLQETTKIQNGTVAASVGRNLTDIITLQDIDGDLANIYIRSNTCQDPYQVIIVQTIDCEVGGRVIVPSSQPKIIHVVNQDAQTFQLNVFTALNATYETCVSGQYTYKLEKYNYAGNIFEEVRKDSINSLSFNVPAVQITLSKMTENSDVGIYRFTLYNEKLFYSKFQSAFNITIGDLSSCIQNYTYQYCEEKTGYFIPPQLAKYNASNYICKYLPLFGIEALFPNQYYTQTINVTIDKVFAYSCNYHAMGLYSFQVYYSSQPDINFTWTLDLQGTPPCDQYFVKSKDTFTTSSSIKSYEYIFKETYEYDSCKTFMHNYKLVYDVIPNDPVNPKHMIVSSLDNKVIVSPKGENFPYNQWLTIRVVSDDRFNTQMILVIYVTYIKTPEELKKEQQQQLYQKNEELKYDQEPLSMDDQVNELKEFDPTFLTSGSGSGGPLDQNWKIQFYNATISSVSEDGLIVLKFEKQLRFKSDNFIEIFRRKGLQIKYFQNNANDEFEVNIDSWNVTKVSDYKIQIQVDFKNSIKVSYNIVTHFALLNVEFPTLFVQVIKSIVEISNGNVIPKEYIRKALSYVTGSLSSDDEEENENYELQQMDIFLIFRDLFLQQLFRLTHQYAMDQINDQNHGAVDILSGFLMVMMLGMVPGFFTFFLVQNRRKARSIEFKKKFGVLYDDYRDFEVKYVVFMFFYFERRFFLALSITFLREYPNFQIYSQIYQSMILIILQFIIRPYQAGIIHFLEFYNEMCIMCINYGFLAINMTEGNDDLQYYITLVLIGHILVNIIVNWLTFFVHLAFFLRLKLSKVIRSMIQKCKNKQKKSDFGDLTQFSLYDSTLYQIAQLDQQISKFDTSLNLNSQDNIIQNIEQTKIKKPKIKNANKHKKEQNEKRKQFKRSQKIQKILNLDKHFIEPYSFDKTDINEDSKDITQQVDLQQFFANGEINFQPQFGKQVSKDSTGLLFHPKQNSTPSMKQSLYSNISQQKPQNNNNLSLMRRFQSTDQKPEIMEVQDISPKKQEKAKSYINFIPKPETKNIQIKQMHQTDIAWNFDALIQEGKDKLDIEIAKSEKKSGSQKQERPQLDNSAIEKVSSNFSSNGNQLLTDTNKSKLKNSNNPFSKSFQSKLAIIKRKEVWNDIKGI